MSVSEAISNFNERIIEVEEHCLNILFGQDLPGDPKSMPANYTVEVTDGFLGIDSDGFFIHGSEKKRHVNSMSISERAALSEPIVKLGKLITESVESINCDSITEATKRFEIFLAGLEQ